MPAEISIFLVVLLLLTLTATGYVLRSSMLTSRLLNTRMRADTDPLTGLMNRGAFNQALREAFEAPSALHLVFIDLDNFKNINDTLGHEAGDAVLTHVSENLRAATPENATVARMGGDEFCILLPDMHVDRAMTICRRLREDSRESFLVHECVISVELSIGLASRLEDCQNAQELLRRADRAMYHAKESENEPVAYTPTLDENQRIKREIRTELGAAFRNDELKLAYQPLACARTGKLVGAEALLRWPSKVGPAGSPAEFIPVAEETGLIIELGEWVLQQALEQISLLETVPIAVNVSPRQFLNAEFSTLVADAIIRAGVAPNLLKIEITESVLITHTDSAERVLRELRDIGVQVLLDDFGTGYSSLSYLQQFPFDILKIDRAFVRSMDMTETGGELLRSIVNMGHSLNMKVVAEGVETKRQAAILQLLGCDYLQGYALGAPSAPEKLRDFDASQLLAPHEKGKLVAI